MTMPAAPERVFPLLCPVREFDWLPHWACEVIHTESGVAEDGCVFQTAFPGDGKVTWVVSAYEPPARIEFTCVAPDLFVMRLKLRLEPHGADETMVGWRREFLSLNEAGDRHLAEHKTGAAHAETMERLERCLRQYLTAAA